MKKQTKKRKRYLTDTKLTDSEFKRLYEIVEKFGGESKVELNAKIRNLIYDIRQRDRIRLTNLIKNFYSENADNN